MRAGGVLYLELQDRYERSSAATAWVISLAVTIRMLFGKINLRTYKCKHLSYQIYNEHHNLSIRGKKCDVKVEEPRDFKALINMTRLV